MPTHSFQTCPRCGGPMLPVPDTDHDLWYCPVCEENLKVATSHPNKETPQAALRIAQTN